MNKTRQTAASPCLSATSTHASSSEATGFRKYACSNNTTTCDDRVSPPDNFARFAHADHHRIGRLVLGKARTHNWKNEYQEHLPSLIHAILFMIVLFVLVIWAMYSVNPRLATYVLVPLPILTYLVYYVHDRINKKSEKVQEQLSVLSTFLQETFSGIRAPIR